MVVQTAASRVEFIAAHPDALGSAEVKCARQGSVLMTSGRVHVLVAADVKTLSADDHQEDSRTVQFRGQMDFSETFSVSARAKHFYDPDDPAGRTDERMASAEGNLIVTSNLDGPDRLVCMSIESIEWIESTASASAS